MWGAWTVSFPGVEGLDFGGGENIPAYVPGRVDDGFYPSGGGSCFRGHGGQPGVLAGLLS